MQEINTTKLRYIVIHHSEVSNKLGNQLTGINNGHHKLFNMRSSLGYYVGYAYLIDSDASVIKCREDGEAQAATIGHNTDAINICLSGNFDIELPTSEQLDALKTLLLQKMKDYNIPRQNIFLHRYFATTSLQSGKWVKNTTSWKTWDGSMPYKSCAGSKLADSFGQDLVAPSPETVSDAEVGQAISILQRLIKLLQDYMASKKIVGMPYYEQFSD